MRSRSWRVLGIAILVLVVVAVVGVGAVTNRSAVRATSRLRPQVTIECSGATGASAAACQAWGDAVLAADPAPPTFERSDLRRVVIDRALLGIGGCSATFFIFRYPDAPVWSGNVPCH